MRIEAIALLVVAATLACSMDSAGPGPEELRPNLAVSATGAQVITEAEIARQPEGSTPTKSWVLYTRAAGTGVFQTGPGTAPEGVGSMTFSTPGVGDKAYLYNYDYHGKALGDLVVLRYSSYRTTAPGAAVVSLNIQVDRNGGALQTGDFTTLVFEPYNNPLQGAIQNGVWQEWDAINGGGARWWATGVVGLSGAPGNCIQSAPCTWTEVRAAVPNATVLGGLGLNQGSGNDGTISSFDKLVVEFAAAGSTTYDFDPWVTATTRDTCKGGGWQAARRADGTTFRNQGDCVSYTETGK